MYSTYYILWFFTSETGLDDACSSDSITLPTQLSYLSFFSTRDSPTSFSTIIWSYGQAIPNCSNIYLLILKIYVIIYHRDKWTNPYNDQKPTGIYNGRELSLSSFLNFLLCIVGQSKSTQEAISTSLGSRTDCQSIEKFKFGMGLKLVKPFEIQGFFLVVPIIQLSPHFAFERFDTFESWIIFEVVHFVSSFSFLSLDRKSVV